MRIIQIIDSLEAGGAERMAVNYANALRTQFEFSSLVCTRKEGLLKQYVHADVSYLFLEKKSALDFYALLRLRRYCVKNKITHIQAHATSFFTAFLVKLLLPQLILIWHDHYGLSEFLTQRRPQLLRICSLFFSGIIAVNEPLKRWALRQLACKKVIYLPNFIQVQPPSFLPESLPGMAGKRIVCLANLRAQKNHFMLLSVAEKLQLSHPDWSFHLVGQDFGDAYAQQLTQSISTKNLVQQVYLYGSRSDISAILTQMDIGILTSDSEGLPLAVLEYGLHALPVVVTDVGEISSVVAHEISGFVLPAQQVDLFYNSLVTLIENQNLRLKFGQALQAHVFEVYSEEQVVKTFLHWINQT